jgi:cell division protein ZapE
VSPKSRIGHAQQLADITPHVSADRLLAEFVPPRHFHTARFDTYRANSQYPSQETTRERLREAAKQISGSKGWLTKFLQNSNKAPAIYMDGGFGVGKTHLLASLAHEVGIERTAYGTFVEYTNLVGALGFAKTVEALAEKVLVCIDEFELDDPGDTVLMSRLLRELADRGVALAATSNTLPDSLGEGRFAAEDFLREIQALAARFEVLRVDGEDYRRRSVPSSMPGLPDNDVLDLAESVSVDGLTTVDGFDEVLRHLAFVHPSQYGAMLDGVALVGLTGVHPIEDQSTGLRFVVLVDRLYDREVPVLLGSSGLDGLFSETMLNGGYRKKYFRALSRLGALAQEGRLLVGREVA